MERWSGRVAVVTGAGSEIGAATAKCLVKNGLKVVGLDNANHSKTEALGKELEKETGKLYPLKADISKEEDIIATFEWIKKNLGGVDILINNAATGAISSLSEISAEKFSLTFQVNVIGSSICTREAIKSMRERVDDGHIININSIAGHHVLNRPTYGMYAYTASKHALRALTEGLRRELVQQKSKIRDSSISPGGVDTEALQSIKDSLPQDIALLHSKDVVDAIIYVLGTPPHVQVHELMIRPVGDQY